MRLLVMLFVFSTAYCSAAADEPPKQRFPALDNAKTWERLPRKMTPLPNWARMLSRSLPKTTAAMLRLDAVHRAHSPLDQAFRAKLRWASAKANRCDYAMQYAEADMLRAGVTRDTIEKLKGDQNNLPEKERLAMSFASKMSLAAVTVTDEEVAALLRHYGPKSLTAMVHTLAYANFQDRILLALGVEVEKAGPLPPLEIDFDLRQLMRIKQPKRPAWSSIQGVKNAAIGARPEWTAKSISELQKSLAGQKARKSRIPLPSSARQQKGLSQSRRPSVTWSDVSFGYAPKLTRAWFECAGVFEQESSLNRVFALSLFWVITQSNECFY